MVQDLERLERLHHLLGEGQRQLDRLEARVLHPGLREDYLEPARNCLDQATEVMKTIEGPNVSATARRQGLLAAETILAVSNRQIRLLLVRLLDTYGPGVLGLTSGLGMSHS